MAGRRACGIFRRMFFGEHEEYKTTKEDLIQAAEKEYHAYYKVYSKVFGEADTRMSRSLKDYVSDYEYRAIAYDKGLILFSALENRWEKDGA